MSIYAHYVRRAGQDWAVQAPDKLLFASAVAPGDGGDGGGGRTGAGGGRDEGSRGTRAVTGDDMSWQELTSVELNNALRRFIFLATGREILYKYK
jgi:hypothetical protein